jgi:hypothetical protein
MKSGPTPAFVLAWVCAPAAQAGLPVSGSGCRFGRFRGRARDCFSRQAIVPSRRVMMSALGGAKPGPAVEVGGTEAVVWSVLMPAGACSEAAVRWRRRSSRRAGGLCRGVVSV